MKKQIVLTAFLLLTLHFTSHAAATPDKIKCVKETYTYQYDGGQPFKNVFYVIGNFVIFDLKWALSKHDKLLFYKDGAYYHNDEGYPTYLGNGIWSEIVYGAGEYIPHIIDDQKEEFYFDATEFYYLLVDNFYEFFLKESEEDLRKDLMCLQIFINRIGNFTKSELRFLRNAIYAKYGYGFKSQDLAEVFSQCDWYDAKKNYSEKYVEDIMTEDDKTYLKLIRLLEK